MESLLEVITKTEEHNLCVEMMKHLDIQRRNEQFCDVILEVGSSDDQVRLKAHRIVLHSCREQVVLVGSDAVRTGPFLSRHECLSRLTVLHWRKQIWSHSSLCAMIFLLTNGLQ